MKLSCDADRFPFSVTCTIVLLLGGFFVSAAPVGRDTIHAIDAAASRGDADTLRAIHGRLYTGSGTADDYYARAYAAWRLAQLLGRDEGKNRKSLLKAARGDLDKLLEVSPDDPEALALRGGVTGALITGAFSGMTLGPKASRDLDKALAIAPDNPRVALMRGINFHFMPATFGGGDDKAAAELQRARQLFGAVADDAYPGWGKVDALGWLGRILAEQDRLDEAIALFDEALQLEPGHHWIRQLRSANVPQD